jgi:hypothetical protein
MVKLLLPLKNMINTQYAKSVWPAFFFTEFCCAIKSQTRFNISGSVVFYNSRRRGLNEMPFGNIKMLKIILIHVNCFNFQ